MLSEDKLDELHTIMPDACFNFLGYWKKKQDEYDNLSWYKKLFRKNPHYFKLDKEFNRLASDYIMLLNIHSWLDGSCGLITEEDYQFVKYWSNNA